jgi:hypothetical protein
MNLVFEIIIAIVYFALLLLFGRHVIRLLKNRTIRPKKFDTLKAFAILAAFIIVIKKSAEGLSILLNKNNYSVESFDNDSVSVYAVISLPILILIYLGAKNNARRTYSILTDWLSTWGIMILVLLFIFCFAIWSFTDKL